jgi:hypothetical protein
MNRILALAIASAVALPAYAADEPTALTLYRADSDQLFQATGDAVSNDGYAVVHERRPFDLKGGTQDLSIGGLPAALDSEALTLRFPGKGTRVVSQRLLLGQGFDGAVAGLVGHDVQVIGSTGQDLAKGILVRGGNPMVLRDGSGQLTVVKDYSALRVTGVDDVARGSSLQVRVDGGSAGKATAQLDYPTTGLGWRGAYVATLAPGDACNMAFDANASIANRSGRDWQGVALKLVAGDAQRAKSVPPPRMMMARAPVAMKAMDASGNDMRQASLGDLRTYTLPHAVDLPDGSVTQAPLYDRHTLACNREAVYDAGTRFYNGSPRVEQDPGVPEDGTPIVTNLRFKAFDSLPAGYVRVLTTDRDGNAELLGEGRIEDTPKNEDATVSLGNAFDLRAKREQTAFNVAGHQIDEGTRITLTNAGDAKRTVTVRERPNRWRAWTLASSSVKPSKATPELLEFKVDVPANGSATLDFAVRYTWTDADIRPR